jgi:hypothetical protein
LVDHRDALLVGIDKRFVQGLNRRSSPSDQMLVDLDELNDVGRLDDGGMCPRPGTSSTRSCFRFLRRAGAATLCMAN